MKKLLLLSVALLCSSLIDAQIIDNKALEPKMVTKATIMGAILIEANWYDDYTTFYFEDSKYETIKVGVNFKLTSEEVDNFYNEVKIRFAKKEFEDKEGFIFQTKEGAIIHTEFVKSMGVKSMRISITKSNVISLGPYTTQKQIKKLFNDQSKS